MNLKFWRRHEKKQGGGISFISLPGGRVSAERLYSYILAFRVSDIVYSVISLIQQAATVVPWYLYERKGDEIEEVEDETLSSFLRRPGLRMNWSRYIETYLGHLLLTGNVYQRIIVPSFKTQISVQFLRPDRVHPRLAPTGAIVYEYLTNGKVEIIHEEEILHTKLFNPEEDQEHLTGLSPIASIARAVDVGSFCTEWILQLLEQGAMPPLVLSTANDLTEEQREFLRQQIKRDVLGPQNAMNPLILEAGLKPEKVGFSPRELNFDHLIKMVLRKVAAAYKVPTELLGDSENKTYSNVQEAERALYYKATLPHLTMLRDELNSWLVPKIDNKKYIDYDTSGIDALAEDMEKIWARAGDAIDRGLITRNEAREMMKFGLSKEPGADRLTIPANVLPLEMIAGTTSEEQEE